MKIGIRSHSTSPSADHAYHQHRRSDEVQELFREIAVRLPKQSKARHGMTTPVWGGAMLEEGRQTFDRLVKETVELW